MFTNIFYVTVNPVGCENQPWCDSVKLDCEHDFVKETCKNYCGICSGRFRYKIISRVCTAKFLLPEISYRDINLSKLRFI